MNQTFAVSAGSPLAAQAKAISLFDWYYSAKPGQKLEHFETHITRTSDAGLHNGLHLWEVDIEHV